MQARAAMTRRVLCLGPDDTLQDAHLLMTQHRVRHVPVINEADGERRLIGILSDRDVLRHGTLVDGLLLVPPLPLGEVCTPEPYTCALTSTVAHVAGLMLDHRIDAVPVVRADGVLLGLITSTDLLELLREPGEHEGKLLPFTFELHREARAAA